MASQKDIAARLGISPSLVSKVLSGHMGTTRADPELIRRIRQIASEMDYRKNRSAEGLRRGRHNVIGTLIHRQGTAGSGIIEELLNGIAAEANRFRQTLLLNFYETVEEFHTASRAVHRGAVDGLLVGGIYHQELMEDLLALQETGVPVVTIHDRQEDERLLNVGIDQVEVGRLATHHLIEGGCRRIAHIKTRFDRYEGYRAALREAGIEEDPDLVMDHEPLFTFPAGEQTARALLERGIAFDGVVAQSDQQAMGVLKVLLNRGVAVPQQVKVTGVDNAPYCEFSAVSLTSVSQQARTRGTLAMRTLVERINGGDARSTVVKPELWIRRSSGGDDSGGA